MRYVLIVFWMLLWAATSSMAELSIGVGLPGLSIGINLPFFPELVPVPGYPVYYAPQLNSNYFFYDGMYWVYQDDNWYASAWYNGPWTLVAPEFVPLFVLRIPVRYYGVPPVYFGGWRSDAPPRWGEHWGKAWEQQHSGWDKWNHSNVPTPAPLPHYQRQYSGERYPQAEQHQQLHNQNYRYQPREAIVQQHYREQAVPRASAPPQAGQQGGPATPPRAQLPQRGGEDVQRAAPPQAAPHQRDTATHDQRPPAVAAQEAVPQGRGSAPEPKRGQGQEKGRDKEEGRGQDRNRSQ